MNFDEFIAMKVKEANDYASGVTDDEQCIAEDAWKAGKLEAAEHILHLWREPWPVSQMRFIDRLEEYVESLKP